MIASDLISPKRESSVSLKTDMIASDLISPKRESSVDQRLDQDGRAANQWQPLTRARPAGLKIEEV
jgi:hypothetical protein